MKTTLSGKRIGIVLLLMLLIGCTTAHAASSAGFLPTRIYNDVTYKARPASELTTILLIGYDHRSEGVPEELHGYNKGGQSDFLMLVVMDHQTEQIRLLQIDRDTMTDVKPTSVWGKQLSARMMQICLAHAYGSTREANNANTIWTVERMLQISGDGDGAQIDWYLAMDISGISRLNELLGGVTVTIPYDMSAHDPAMTEGAVLKLNGKQAEIFCRGRYGVGDQTNASRMIRQRAYFSAAGDQLVNLIRQDKNFASELLDGMGVIYDRAVSSTNPFVNRDEGTPTGNANGKYLMSSETRSGMVNTILRAVEYEVQEVETLPGQHSLGPDGYIRYDLEKDAAVQWMLSVFFTMVD